MRGDIVLRLATEEADCKPPREDFWFLFIVSRS